ncbi:hypothetical protein ISP17_03390 [Dyella ginsengisoli]|uniref:DUF998 domain-containing protein n=1 Tax=Dyella ginsengisoli TaxID=363848 RepID=A0ABW8JQ41_9GAMM
MRAPSIILTVIVAFFLCLLGYSIYRIKGSKEFSLWVGQGRRDVFSKSTLFGLLALEFSIMLGTIIPYAKFGSHKEIYDYTVFAFPCLAGIVAGGGIFFDGKSRLDGAGWSFFASAVILAVAYVVFIWPAGFAGQIWFWTIINSTAACVVGLAIIAIRKDYGSHPLDGLFLPIIIFVGIATVLLGMVFFFFSGALSPLSVTLHES